MKFKLSTLVILIITVEAFQELLQFCNIIAEHNTYCKYQIFSTIILNLEKFVTKPLK